MVKSLSDSIDQTKNIEGQIILAVKSPLFKNEAWVLVESSVDQKVYKKMFKGNVMVLPAVKEDNKSPNCWSVESIVSNILNRGCTQYVVGIRDTDYTRYWHECAYSLPQNIVHTHHRDIEMLMLSASSCLNALNHWNSSFQTKIAECVPYISFMGYLRVWFDNYGDRNICDLKKFKWGRILLDGSQEVADDWKRRLTNRFNELCHTNLTADDVELYANERGLDTLSFYDICRGHDFLPCLANRMVKTSEYTERTIRDKMTAHYSTKDFWGSETGKRLKSIVKTWNLGIIKH